MDQLDAKVLQDLRFSHSITKTAMNMYMSQPALSKRLHKLSKTYQTEIVRHTSRGTELTEAGRLLCEFGQAQLDNENRLKNEILRLSGKTSGTLYIGASGFITHQIPPLLRLYKNQNPAVTFNLKTDWSELIYQDLTKDEIQVAFVRGHYHWHEHKHALFTETLSLISPYPIDFRDLPNLPRIDYQCDHKLQEQIDDWWQMHYSVPPKIEIKVDRTNTCCIMVNNHLGYAIVPTFIAQQWKGQLFQQPLEDLEHQPISRTTWLLSKNSSQAQPLVADFIKFIERIDFLKWIQ